MNKSYQALRYITTSAKLYICAFLSQVKTATFPAIFVIIKQIFVTIK